MWVDPLPLTHPAARATLLHAMPALLAEEALRAGTVADKDVYDAALMAFGSEEIAARLYADRIAARYRAGERPDL